MEFYKSIYILGQKLSKRERFGINSKIENIALEAWELATSAALTPKEIKLPIIENLRIKIEILKKLVRLESELKIIGDKPYMFLEEQLQEISKMANGWIKYIKQKEL